MRICVSNQEIYYVDSKGDYWDEVSNKNIDKNEVLVARLDEIKQVHNHGVYEKSPNATLLGQYR